MPPLMSLIRLQCHDGHPRAVSLLVTPETARATAGREDGDSTVQIHDGHGLNAKFRNRMQ